MNFHAENITFRANPSQSSLLLNIRILYIKGRQRNDIRICYPISGTDTLDVLFLSNLNIRKSLCGLYFWASDPLIERLY